MRKTSLKVGDKISKLKIQEILKERGSRGEIYLKCICECNEVIKIRADTFRSGKFRNCPKCGIYSSFDWLSYLIYSYKNTAKDRNISFNLSNQEFNDLIIKNCFYCNCSPKERKIKRGKKLKSITYNGIDRINSDEGYELKNCVPCCYTCNIAKSDMSFDEFINHIEKIYKNLNFNK